MAKDNAQYRKPYLLIRAVSIYAVWNVFVALVFQDICERKTIESDRCLCGTASCQGDDVTVVERDALRRPVLCDKPVGFVKALYFAVQTTTSVGYGSGLKLEDDGLRWFVIFCMSIGAIVLGYFVALCIPRGTPENNKTQQPSSQYVIWGTPKDEPQERQDEHPQ